MQVGGLLLGYSTACLPCHFFCLCGHVDSALVRAGLNAVCGLGHDVALQSLRGHVHYCRHERLCSQQQVSRLVLQQDSSVSPLVTILVVAWLDYLNGTQTSCNEHCPCFITQVILLSIKADLYADFFLCIFIHKF